MAQSPFYSNGMIVFDDDDDRWFSQKYRSVNLQENSKRKDDESHPERKHSRTSDFKPRKPQFDDARLFCDDCQQFHENLCPYHDQMYIPDRKNCPCHDEVSTSTLNETDRLADLTCPDGLIIKTSTIATAGKGVFASERFEKNTYFGPYAGSRHRNFQSAQESGYAWSIADKDGKMVHIVDGRDPKRSNWMRYVSSDDDETGSVGSDCLVSGPNYLGQQNLLPVQYDRNMFYKTTRAVDPGEELFVYYGDDYARFLGIEPFVSDQIETRTDLEVIRDH